MLLAVNFKIPFPPPVVAPEDIASTEPVERLLPAFDNFIVVPEVKPFVAMFNPTPVDIDTAWISATAELALPAVADVERYNSDPELKPVPELVISTARPPTKLFALIAKIFPEVTASATYWTIPPLGVDDDEDTLNNAPDVKEFPELLMSIAFPEEIEFAFTRTPVPVVNADAPTDNIDPVV